MRIVLGKIDAVPAAGGLMAIKVQANTGTTYEILVDPERARIFAEAIEAVMANWDEAPLIQAKASAQEAASPQRPRKATQAPKPPSGAGRQGSGDEARLPPLKCPTMVWQPVGVEPHGKEA